MGRVLGVDLGAVRIGLALSDPGAVIASPLTVLTRSGDPDVDRQAVVAAAREHGADTIVVGLPRALSGAVGPAATAALAEVDALRALASDLRIEVVDERLTTVVAEHALRAGGARRAERKASVDKVAAAVILQSYLDAGPAGPAAPRSRRDARR